MLNSVGEWTPPCGTPIFKLTLSGCVVSICCVGFASLDVHCNGARLYSSSSHLFDCCIYMTISYDDHSISCAVFHVVQPYLIVKDYVL